MNIKCKIYTRVKHRDPKVASSHEESMSIVPNTPFKLETSDLSVMKCVSELVRGKLKS